ncbi:MAG: hypothetical protein IBJ03_15215 [Gemmatimonadaceae bacterium]|nr:hypothetical protein [Gemmatimonadaceae bacterium]
MTERHSTFRFLQFLVLLAGLLTIAPATLESHGGVRASIMSMSEWDGTVAGMAGDNAWSWRDGATLVSSRRRQAWRGELRRFGRDLVPMPITVPTVGSIPAIIAFIDAGPVRLRVIGGDTGRSCVTAVGSRAPPTLTA